MIGCSEAEAGANRDHSQAECGKLRQPRLPVTERITAGPVPHPVIRAIIANWLFATAGSNCTINQMPASQKLRKYRMDSKCLFVAIVGLLLIGGARLHADDKEGAPKSDAKPTLFIVGDSTVKNGTRGQMGWGDPISGFFDTSRIRIENRARGGRSSRTFQTEGLWDRVLADAKPGDFVLIQMGHNDGGPLDDPARARGSIRGIGEETREIDNPITKKKETVHTYGWYLRKYIADARAKGM